MATRDRHCEMQALTGPVGASGIRWLCPWSTGCIARANSVKAWLPPGHSFPWAVQTTSARKRSGVAGAMALTTSVCGCGGMGQVASNICGGDGRPVIKNDVTLSVKTVPTEPIAGQAPGTSGLRKKTKVFMEGNYLANYVQSVFNTLIEENVPVQGGTLVVSGDGRYWNPEAIQIIIKTLA
ncbi:PGMP [Symbiodinium necroappetens]|uniref:PGMP protein n=1 Tax=Symbiodinium necroappetens TaxID=1628268 RepID=A0A812YI08_9DINO|nr:PGMP [Symbiodinium necroappetens]